MLRVQFNDQKSMQQVEFTSVSADVVQLTGKKVPKDTSGFKMYRLKGDFLGDYSDFTKIVGEVENGLQFGRQ